ncbi:glucosaminidase domain-containing protein, partial [bacterium]|nr:glucosaminidase domain-containing protein [bacterium]
ASMFDGLPKNKKSVMTKFAPLAVYLQSITGYPASVIMGHMVKEKGWKTKATGNAFFFIGCNAGSKDDNFTPAQGAMLKVNHSGCGDRWQHYASPQDSFLGYIYWMLYADNGYYNGVRRVIPSNFPPPADREKLINAIASSGYCQEGCSCDLGKGKKGKYGTCMKSIIKNSCAAHLDNMVLCDGNSYEILDGLPAIRGGGSSKAVKEEVNR